MRTLKPKPLTACRCPYARLVTVLKMGNCYKDLSGATIHLSESPGLYGPVVAAYRDFTWWLQGAVGITEVLGFRTCFSTARDA